MINNHKKKYIMPNSEKMKRVNQKHTKAVIEICSMTGKAIKRYDSIKQAVKNTTITSASNLRRAINVKRATAGGSCWKLFKDWLIDIKKIGNIALKEFVKDYECSRFNIFTKDEIREYQVNRLNLACNNLENSS
jgi:hypothetical protein